MLSIHDCLTPRLLLTYIPVEEIAVVHRFVNWMLEWEFDESQFKCGRIENLFEFELALR